MSSHFAWLALLPRCQQEHVQAYSEPLIKATPDIGTPSLVSTLCAQNLFFFFFNPPLKQIQPSKISSANDGLNREVPS